MKVLAVLAALASTASAGDGSEVRFAMQRVAGPPHERLDETRYVPELGAVWRYGQDVVLYDGEAWWQVSGTALNNTRSEVETEGARLELIVRDGHVGFALTATSRSRGCHGSGHCDAWQRITNRIVCTRDARIACAFEWRPTRRRYCDMTDMSRRWLQAGALVAGVWLFTMCRTHETTREVREVDDSQAAYVGEVDGDTHVSFAAPAALHAMRGAHVLCAATRSGHARCELAYDRDGRATAPRRLLREDEIAARLANVELTTKQGAWTLAFSDPTGAFASRYHAPSSCFDSPDGHDCVVRFDADGKLRY